MKIKRFLFGALPESTSPSFSLDTLDRKKTARLFVVAIAGAAATAALDFIAQYMANIDLGVYKAFLFPIITAGVEAARRFIAENLYKEE